MAGTAGGESDLDPVRGVYNEDGLYAERVGWHLPGFDDSDWELVKSEKNSSLSFTGATVKFFRAVIPPLSIPEGVDVSISFVFSTASNTTAASSTANNSNSNSSNSTSDATAFRAQLFVNGYQYGRYNPYVGNQVVYPVPPGVLDYNEENTIGVAVWAQTEAGAQLSLDWKVNYVLDSSLDAKGLDVGGLRPGWSKEREKFA